MEEASTSGQAVPPAGQESGLGVVFVAGRAYGVASEVGALSIVHGALQSAIGSVDAALELERVYHSELDKRQDR